MSQMPCITPRKRSQFVVDLEPRELDCEGRELEEAALRLSSLEAGQACADTDRLACVDGAGSNEEFDEKLFMKEVRAQKGKRSEVPRALTE